MLLSKAEAKRRYDKRIAGARDNKIYIGPEIVSLRIGNSCNLSCKFCWIHSPGNPSRLAPPSTLRMQKIHEVIRDSIELEADQIHIIANGEPSLHPDFRQIMRDLEAQPIKTKLLTNATFPPDYCKDVIRADHVLIDLSAVDKEHYLEVQGKDLFERVTGNIKRLVALRDSEKPSFRMEIAYIVNSLNVDHKQQMLDLAKELGVPSVDFKMMNEHPDNKKVALSGVFDLGGSSGNKKTPPVCLNGWFYMGVSEDVATECCLIPQMGLGALSKDTLKDIWHSPRAMKMRLLGKYGHIQKMYSACQTCSFYDQNIQRQEAMEHARQRQKAAA